MMENLKERKGLSKATDTHGIKYSEKNELVSIFKDVTHKTTGPGKTYWVQIVITQFCFV